MKMINTLNNNRPKLFNWVLTLLCVLMVQQSAWAATNSIISNMAVGEYSEEGSTVVQVARSNLVQTTILPVYSLNLVAANNKTVVAGQTVYFNHILTNTSNDTDQYTFAVSNNLTGDDFDFVNSSLMVYLDANNDGVPDGLPITGYTLGAGQSVGLIVAATIPNTITTGKVANLTVAVTSINGATGTNSNVDKATVTDQSTLMVRKKFSQTTAANGDIVTIRLDYQNPSNVATGNITLTDTLDSTLTYQSNSGENWNGTTVDPATGANDPTGINYYVSSNVVTAVLTSIPANSIGYIEFKVKINKSIAGKIENFVNVTGTTTDKTNTAIVNVAPVYAVKINGSASNVNDNTNTITASAVPQGGELKFTNYVWNTGNTTDRFNLTLTGSTFPAGSQIELYRADGVTPLLDSNGDGIPDTGLLAANTSVPVVVKVRFPSSYAVTTNTVFEVTPQAQSVSDSSKTSTIKDQGTLTLTLVSQLVDLTNADNTGQGNGVVDNNGAAWKTLTVKSSNNPVTGGQAIFPLRVKHTGVGTEYLLSANASSDFSSLTLPAGVNRVRFYASTNGTNCSGLGNEIGKTIYLNDEETQLVCAVVEVDKVNNDITVPIYFRVISTSFVATGNPAQDIIKDAITIQSVNSKPQLEFMPDLYGQVAPLGTVVYSHLLVNHSDTAFSGSYDFVLSNDQSEFNAKLYYDANNNGQFDGGDTLINHLSDLPSGGLASQSQVRLFVQVNNTASNNVTQSNTTIVNLKDSANQIVASVKDVTTVNKSQLSLTKLQARDFNCDGTADEAYSLNKLNIGKQGNGQGQCVLYKVTLNNSGPTINNVFTFRDMTPAYTVLSKVPTCTSCSGTTAPALNNAGELTGTLNSVVGGQSYEFSFGVRYVGQ